MALQNFGADSFVVTVNGRLITAWGESDPPYTDDPIDQTTTMRRGLGGTAVRLDRINPGRTITINLNPGSSDSGYLQGLFNSKANITLSKETVGTGEKAIGTEGAIINDGQSGRGGATSITDDQFIIECNIWTESKGSSD